MTNSSASPDPLWFWQTDDDSWYPFTDEHSSVLERCYASGDDSVILQREEDGVTLYVDLGGSARREMTQRNVDTGFVRSIRRGWPLGGDEERFDGSGKGEDGIGGAIGAGGFRVGANSDGEEEIEILDSQEEGVSIPSVLKPTSSKEHNEDHPTDPSKSGDLDEGEERKIEGSTAGTHHTVKLVHGVYSCSCPAWRYAGGPIDNRTCKHLRSVRGDAAEQCRVGAKALAAVVGRKRKRGTTEAEALPLQGKVVCFTGALGVTRAEASRMAALAGALVSKSVTRKTNVLVVGARAGTKLSDAEARGDGVEVWDEGKFICATSGVGDCADDDGDPEEANRSTAAANGDNGTIPSRIVLAQTYGKGGNDIDPTGWLLSEKLDGMRAFWDGHSNRLWSRTGKVIHAPDWWSSSLPRGIFLDGELWLGRGKFQECMGIVRRQDRPKSWENVCFLVFDAPDDLDGAQATYEERHRKASEAIDAAASSSVVSSSSSSVSSISSSTTTVEVSLSGRSFAKMHPYDVCQGKDHLERKLREVEALKGEGLMLRKPKSKYRPGRSSDLLKVKSSRDDEGVVLSHESGRGKHVGRVGAVRIVNRNGKRFKVGSGFTDEQREKPPQIGSVITYRYNELTDGGVPRFPVFVRVRPDVEAADVYAASE